MIIKLWSDLNKLVFLHKDPTSTLWVSKMLSDADAFWLFSPAGHQAEVSEF